MTKESHKTCPVAFPVRVWWGQHHSLRNQGSVCGSAFPWASAASDGNDTEMHLPGLIFWLTRLSSHQTEPEIFIRVMKGIKPRNVLFTAHVLSSLFMGNSFQLCPSVGCSGSEVMPLKQPELLQIYAAARGGGICLTAFDVSCASQAALCLRLWVSPDSLIFTSCPCKATCKCVYWSSTIISYSSGWLTCQKWMSFFRPLFLQVLVV